MSQSYPKESDSIETNNIFQFHQASRTWSRRVRPARRACSSPATTWWPSATSSSTPRTRTGPSRPSRTRGSPSSSPCAAFAKCFRWVFAHKLAQELYYTFPYGENQPTNCKKVKKKSSSLYQKFLGITMKLTRSVKPSGQLTTFAYDFLKTCPSWMLGWDEQKAPITKPF